MEYTKVRGNTMKFLTYCCLLYNIARVLFFREMEDEEEAIVPRLIMGVICLYCLFVLVKNQHSIVRFSFFHPFLLFLVLSFVYILYPLNNTNGNSVVGSNATIWLKHTVAIPYMAVCFIGLLKDEKRTIKYMFIIFAIQFVYALYCLYDDIRLSREAYKLIIESRSGFLLSCCIPMSLLLNHHRLRCYLYGILLVSCLMCGQRSAALSALLTIPFAIPLLKSSVKRYDIIIVFFMLVLVGGPLIQSAVENFQTRHALDVDRGYYGSGRDVFWRIVWDGFWEKSPVLWVIGNGTGTVRNLLLARYGLAIYAHNGWLDTLYHYGFIGLIIYIKMLSNIIKLGRIVSRVLRDEYYLCWVIVVILLIKFTTSHGDWDFNLTMISMPISIVLYRYYKRIGYIKNYRSKIIGYDKDKGRFIILLARRFGKIWRDKTYLFRLATKE